MPPTPPKKSFRREAFSTIGCTGSKAPLTLDFNRLNYSGSGTQHQFTTIATPNRTPTPNLIQTAPGTTGRPNPVTGMSGSGIFNVAGSQYPMGYSLGTDIYDEFVLMVRTHIYYNICYIYIY